MQLFMVTTEQAQPLLDEIFAEYDAEYHICCNAARSAFIAHDGREIVGAITFVLFYGEAYIDDLAVKKEHRGKGVGRKLISEVENYCSRLKISHITLNTYQFQAPNFYVKMGYQLEFVRKHKDNDKLDRYYFIKNLD